MGKECSKESWVSATVPLLKFYQNFRKELQELIEDINNSYPIKADETAVGLCEWGTDAKYVLYFHFSQTRSSYLKKFFYTEKFPHHSYMDAEQELFIEVTIPLSVSNFMFLGLQPPDRVISEAKTRIHEVMKILQETEVNLSWEFNTDLDVNR